MVYSVSVLNLRYTFLKYKVMKNLKTINTLIIFVFMGLLIGASSCSSSSHGKKVKEPFQGSKYQSNNNWFRAVGKGSSSQDNIAKSKADLDAKTVLAGQLNTSVKKVADQYLGQTENESAADVADKFQSLSREVMNTEMADLRKFDEEKYYNGEKYTVYVAYEIKKNAMFRYLKKQAKTSDKLNDSERKTIEDMIDAELEKLDEDE
jgi:hypothetical protein